MSDLARICIVSEWLHGHPDEGIHNLAQNFLEQWKKDYHVWAIKIGADFSVNRLFLSRQLHKTLQDIKPDFIFYISPSCAKIWGLLRARVLKAYASSAIVLVVAAQPSTYSYLERKLLPLVMPDGIFVQSPRGKELLQEFHCPVHFLPSGVDLQRFVRVDANQKATLRKRYGLSNNEFVVLHVGHVQQTRNVQLLADIARMEKTQVLLVGSTSTPPDEILTHQLSQLGVCVIREFIPHIEELYQLADVYFFPVISENAAIGVPLSVLEAMACNLPVITTRFGGLPQMFPGEQGLFYFEDVSEVPKLMKEVQHLPECLTREMVEPYTWDHVAHNVLETVRGKKV